MQFSYLAILVTVLAGTLTARTSLHKRIVTPKSRTRSLEDLKVYRVR